MERLIKAAVVGYGNRGQVYADYSLDCPNELKIVGVVEPNLFRLNDAKNRYHLEDNQLFTSLEEFIKQHLEVDIVINATMDQDHFETGKAILNAGYNMLIEKPIVPNKEELIELTEIAKKNNSKVLVCHVLRYTPFYRLIKKLLLEGEIGEIMTMEMNEHVCLAHFLTSYDRGKWNDEKTCGSSFLLAKCCHDMDLISWLNNNAKPLYVSSFGSRNYFVKEKMPKDATEYCYQCPHYKTCVLSSKNMYLDINAMPFLTWAKLDKDLDKITDQEKEEFLKKDNYGRCAFIAGGDLIDRQSVSIQFDNGSVANFVLVAGTVEANRYIHIIGTNGEIEGKVEDNKFVVRKHVLSSLKGEEIVYDLSKDIVNNAKFGGHFGGDFSLMQDLVRYLRTGEQSISITSLCDSINSHLIVFAADKSRKEHEIIKIKEN